MANPLQFKPVPKDSYFYGKYRYCIAFTLDEANALKSLDHEYIDAIIERRILWREVAQQRWSGGAQNFKHTIISKRWRPITDKTSEDLHDFAEILISTSVEYKLVTSINNGWVYTNNVSLIKKLKNLDYLTDKDYTEAVVSRPKNTVKLKTPKHTHRSYLKSIKLSNQQKQNLINFFANQAEHVRVAPAFNKWLVESPYLRTQDYFFIDHIGESWLVMVNLIYPGLIRKTMEIIPA
jgi:hypothetical protein